MTEDNELKHSFRERTHAEKMRAIGIEPPEHVPKRFKTAWDQLVHDFPCSSELQHKVWDRKIKRMFARDCGFPVDWKCGCLKCETAVATELSLFEEAVCHDNDRKLPAERSSIVDGTLDTLSLRGATMGVEVVVPRSYYHGPEVWQGNDPVVNFIHLFVDEDTDNDPDAPKTPFCTAVGVISGRFVAPRPRLMWIRAKGLEPTHLSFK